MMDKKSHKGLKISTRSHDPIEIVKLIIECHGCFPFSRVCMVRAFELYYVLHESRYQILLFFLCYGYQFLIDDIYDFLDCVIDSARCFFADNFELRI